ncbi:MAG: hypothetical protein US52_C0028G0003 [candidate division WS6 bacterium GW2011_GWA2_37_6]|uniref:Uncharacterized protein n=1 Tax=candidate division WS6 bacterium GW2011_GWA2_37_6 TaxID=1619087 RepID=A0A0G0H9W6_9BACT|nr:MAG: hypothetical protein US52_C0028G0003 [candidate division WS6 bacterium GW2011_GWA2_37_6]
MNEPTARKFASRKIILVIFSFILIFIVIGIISFILLHENDEGTPSGPAAEAGTGELDEVKEDNSLVFTHDIFDTSRVSTIGPLGELNGGADEAQALNGVLITIDHEYGENPKKMAVYAPQDMRLEFYSYHTYGNEPPGWSLGFAFDENVKMKIDHITEVSQKIMDATTTKPLANDSSEKYPKTAVEVKAGELIAYTTGTSLAHNWNIYIYEKTNENYFVNLDRYKNSQAGNVYLTAVCPFKYYSGEMQAKYIALMGQSAPGQSADCGNASNDVEGTLAGMWHLNKEEITYNYDGNYANPVSIYANSANEVIIAEVNRKNYRIAANSKTYKDPESIIGEHCFSLVNKDYGVTSGYAYFKIVSDTEMKMVYKGTGSCPTAFPASGAKTYYR